MPKNPHADFTPALEGYSGQGKFRFWCQMALPLTYDDSLSYYELLCKVVNYLNHTIEDVANAETNVSRLAEAYTQLQNYVNNYFDDLDIEAELRNVLDAMAEDGTLDDLLDPLVQDHLPSVVDDQIDDVVADQIGDAVASQIDDVVAEQLPPLVDEGIPGKVSDWLTENVDPVGSAVVVDSSLTISGAAADAKVTGDELADLKTQISIIDDSIYKYTEMTASAISAGYRLNESDGYCSANSDYKLLKYPVTAGDVIKIVSDDRFQFQRSVYVTERGELYRIGITYGSGTYVLTVPDGATYLIVSTPTSSNADVYTTDNIKAIIEEINNELTPLHTYYPITQRNGSWANSANANAVTIGRFNIPEGTKEVALDTDRPVDGANGYYRIGYTFLSTPVGTIQHTTTGLIQTKGYETTPFYNFGDKISVPDGSKTVVFTIAQFNSDDTPVPLRTNSFNSYRLRMSAYGSSISELPKIETNKKIKYARHNRSAITPPNLTLVHFSDLHKDTGALNRIVNQSEELNNISDIICTGDMVGNTYEDANTFSAWWNSKVLTCIGNHDSATYTSGVGYDWIAVSMANRDAYYIAPFESEWDIVHTSGTSYYYKDYTDEKVRLIVMDAMLYSTGAVESEASGQNTWLTNLLSDAITNNLHVLIAIHAPHGGATAENCSFSKYGQGTMPTNNDCNTPQDVIDIVATAQNNGLKFVGYLVGHTHQDNVWDAENDGKQLMYCVTCANVSQTAQWIESDQYRDKENDAYNIITINTANTLVKIIRGGGADIDDHMRTRKAICFNYSTGEKVGEIL